MQRYRQFILIFGLLLPLLVSAKDWQWQDVGPGVEYAVIQLPGQFPGGRVHAFRLDLSNVTLKLAFAKNLQQSYATAAEYAKYYHAWLAINGGFFTPGFEPLGLRINQGKREHELKNISWWGVFYVKHHRPQIASMHGFRTDPKINFAIQGGPRLVVNGQVVRLKPGLAERTAIGITNKDQVILLVTDDMPMTLDELANFMAKPESHGGLGCRYALNLDGGSSTQLYANLPSLQLSVVGLKAVADAILVFPQEANEE